MNANEEAKKLAHNGVNSAQIRNELRCREIPEQELRYFGTKGALGGIFAQYSTGQLRSVLVEMEAREADEQYAIYAKEQEKEHHMKNGIYEDIKERLAKCVTKADYESAYKWLAEQFVEVNESAKRFEDRFVEKYGNEAFGELVYGSKEAYEKEQLFSKRLESAQTQQERVALLMEKALFASECEEEEPVQLWDDEEYEYEENAAM